MLWEHVAPVRSERQDQVSESVPRDQRPAGVLQIDARIAEQSVHNDQLFVVYLQYVALLERSFDHFLRIKVLPEVDIEYPVAVAVVGHPVEKPGDRLSRNGASLGERSETNGPRPFGQGIERVGVGDVVPCHAGADIVAQYASRIEFDLHGAGRKIYSLQQVSYPFAVRARRRR